MSVTNGYNTQLVIAALQTRLAFMQPTVVNYTGLITAPNLQNDSGKYFNDYHALCCAENVKDLQNDPAISTTDFNTWLRTKTNSICLTAVNSVFTKHEVVDETSLIFNKDVRFYKLPVINESKICGLRIVVAQGDLATQINSVELLTDAAATFMLYLYQDMQQAPIWSQSVTATGTGQNVVQLFASDGVSPLVLNYLTPTVNKGGTFFLCYDQNQLATQNATAYSFNLQVNAFKAYRAESFESAKTGDNWIFDRYVYATRYQTYGINAEITTYRDYTNNIVQAAKAGVFDDLIGLQMACFVIEQTLFNRRSNLYERKAGDMQQAAQLYRDLNGGLPTEEMPFELGLKGRIRNEIKKVHNSFQKHPRVTVTGAC